MLNSYGMAESVNSDVNARTSYVTDLEQFDVPEFWCEADRIGDCEDYALLKRALLKKKGFDESCIHVATCWINVESPATGHCVLIVETDKGQFILDNNLDFPVPLNFETANYKYLWNIIERGGKWYEFSIS